MLSNKLEGVLTRTIIEPSKALSAANQTGAIMTMSVSWHRIADEKKKEKVDMGEFNFLIAKDGKPYQVEVNFEKGQFKNNVIDISKEMGDVSDEEQFIKQVKFLSDQEILAKLEGDGRVQKALTKAKHLRVYSMDFVIYDEEYQAPIWKVTLKNWPLTNYWRREKPVTVEAVIEGTRGKMIACAVYQS